MSHITTIKTEIKDLEALKSACVELGLEFKEAVKSYRWFGTQVGTQPAPADLSKGPLGTCDHVIRVPGVEYEIGVVQTEGKWALAYDYWGPGEGLLARLGPDCQKLVQAYAVHKATREAKRKGYAVRRLNQKDGSIKLIIGT